MQYRSTPAYGQTSNYAPRHSAARPATTVSVGAYDNYFQPQTISVLPGTTIHWQNAGKHPHTVTANDGAWDSGNIPPGASYSATFQRPGVYYYYCRHHTKDQMRGTVVVGQGGASYSGASYSGSQPSGKASAHHSSGY
jgi:plastocyanin